MKINSKNFKELNLVVAKNHCGLFTNVRVDILDIRGEKFVEIYHNNERIYMNMVREAYFELKNDDNFNNRLHLSVY